jgi:hypothetical protein
MGKDARRQVNLTEDARKKLADCVAALASCRFGPEGPPLETTFAEIEDFGHEMGRMLARSLDQELTQQHSTHFSGSALCPCCQTECPIVENPKAREVQTIDGDVSLHELACHCPVCDRDFFPSA